MSKETTSGRQIPSENEFNTKYPRAFLGRASANIVPNADFVTLEKEILEYWAKEDIFNKSIINRDAHPEWVFYDGPPFANGLPHYGHLLTGYAKDIFPRYKTMCGMRVRRVWGWDTHGLPAELEAMKQLKISTKEEIEQMGILAFTRSAKEHVFRYVNEWKEYVERQGRWVDFDGSYKTLDITYMESVIWAFKQLYLKNLVYEDFRVLPYCTKDETPLSSHELRMDDEVYKKRQDQSITVKFRANEAELQRFGIDSGINVYFLAWTTTPWTLPSNLALAVHPDTDYCVIKDAQSGDHYILSVHALESYYKDLGYLDCSTAHTSILHKFKGAKIVGIRYAPIWDYLADTSAHKTQKAFCVLAAEFVNTADGTGIVHMSPAHGEDDKQACDAAGIPTIVCLDRSGRFLPIVADFAGMFWQEANLSIIKSLKQKHDLFSQKSYSHSYPHCYRCKNPLIYMAVSSWFVQVTAIKERLLDLAKEITWIPKNVKDGQFGKWLAGARDWAISRNRYWGTPIPVWKSTDPAYPRVDVYGSLQELEEDFGVKVEDLHRPQIDALTRPNPDDPTGKSQMVRVEDVLDVWFDSASMPFAQVHYPFENAQWFKDHLPCDFVVEYIGQTRGWFYVMHVMCVALFDQIAYRNAVAHGVMLGDDGAKMSKSLQNYPDVNIVFNSLGSDAMRWFLVSSSILRGGTLSVVSTSSIKSSMRDFLLPFWSSYNFFCTYANVAIDSKADLPANEKDFDTSAIDFANAPKTIKKAYLAREILDADFDTIQDPLNQYILAKLQSLKLTLTQGMEDYDLVIVCDALRDFLDILTNWYIRRSRDVFWTGIHFKGDALHTTGREHFDTLFTVLKTLSLLAAPVAPFLSECVYRGLTGRESVHLDEWPESPKTAASNSSHELVNQIDTVRKIVSAALAIRKDQGLRVRLPLPSMTLLVENIDDFAFLQRYKSILLQELNIKEFFIENLNNCAYYGVDRVPTINAKEAGPRLGERVQDVIRNTKAGNWEVLPDGRLSVAGIELLPNEYTFKIQQQKDTSSAHVLGRVVSLDYDAVLVLRTQITPELAQEAIARDVVRAVQDERKAQGLEVSDRIELLLETDADSCSAIKKHAEFIKAECLALQLVVSGELTAQPERAKIPHTYRALKIAISAAG